MSDHLAATAKRAETVNDAVIRALRLLHVFNDATTTTESFVLEREDRALTDLVDNHHRAGDPRRLVRDARANASKVMRRRARLAPMVQDESAMMAVASTADAPDALLELRERLARVVLSAGDEKILGLLAAGYETTAIAQALGCTEAQVRVRVHRARARFYDAWAAA